MTSILGTTPPEDWNATQIAGIKKLRSQINAVKNAPNRHIPGVAQLANLKKEAGGSQKWLLVEQTTNVNDIISNFGAAVKLMKYALISAQVIVVFPRLTVFTELHAAGKAAVR